MKKIISCCAVLMLTLGLLVSTAFAINGFSTSSHDVIESFADEYGWDTSSITAGSWTGTDGKEYKRTVGHQEEYLNDLYNSMESHCLDLGIVTEYNPTASGAMSIVQTAIQEIGVTEIKSNQVKYNDWFYGRTVNDNDGGFYPWCVAFIAWCANECDLLGEGKPFLKTAGCSQMSGYFREQGFEEYSITDIEPLGGSEYMPVPGDIVFYSGYSHIGLVVEVGNDYIETVEGNAGNQVTRVHITRNNLFSGIAGGTIYHVIYPNDYWTVFYFLTNPKGMNLSEAAAAGICANIEKESNFRPNAYGDVNCGGSLGICQWHLEREQRLRNFCDAEGYDCYSMEGQLHYLQYELENFYPDVLSAIAAVPDDASGADEAARIWCIEFERPANSYLKAVERGDLAENKYYPEFEGKKKTDSNTDKPSHNKPGSGIVINGDGSLSHS